MSVRKGSKTFRPRNTSKDVTTSHRNRKIPGGLGLDIGEVLELQLHGGHIVPRVSLHQVLDVLVKIASGNLSVTGENSLNMDHLMVNIYCVINEICD